MIKNLSKLEAVKELLKTLKNKKEGFWGYTRDNDCDEWVSRFITGVNLSDDINGPFTANGLNFYFCGIEVPDEYEQYPDSEHPNINCGDVIVNKKSKEELLVLRICKFDDSYNIYYTNGIVSNVGLFHDYTKLDGSIIGKKKEVKNGNRK